jgi:hypothetical protein
MSTYCSDVREHTGSRSQGEYGSALHLLIGWLSLLMRPAVYTPAQTAMAAICTAMNT